MQFALKTFHRLSSHLARFRKLVLGVSTSGLLFSSVPYAPPPPHPISWTMPQMILSVPNSGLSMTPSFLKSRGDTIVAGLSNNLGSSVIGRVNVSVDGAISWRGWRLIEPDTSRMQRVGMTSAITSAAVLVPSSYFSGSRNGLYRSSDFGLSWSSPSNYHSLNTIYDVHGDTVLIQDSTSYSITWTIDNGQTYAPAQYFIEGTQNYWRICDAKLQNGYIHVFASYHHPQQNGYFLWYRRFQVDGNNPGPMIQICSENPWTDNARVEFDSTGHGIVVVSTTDVASYWWQLLTYQTFDQGLSWRRTDYIQPNNSGDWSGWIMARDRNYCVIGWADTSHIPGYPRHDNGGQRIMRFSANRGKSWYPPQVIQQGSYDWLAENFKSVQIRNDTIQVYLTSQSHNRQRECGFHQSIGVIHKDLEAPILQRLEYPPDTVEARSIVRLQASARDNDSIWRVEFITIRTQTNESFADSLINIGSNRFYADYTVPSIPGRYRYYFRAEDMWENSAYTDTINSPSSMAWFEVVASKTDDEPPLPKNLTLSIYPNPGNSHFTITGLSLPGQPVSSLTIVDRLGRAVNSLPVHSSITQTTPGYRLFWNGCDRSGRPVSTGQYYLQTIGGMHQTIPFSVIR